MSKSIKIILSLSLLISVSGAGFFYWQNSIVTADNVDSIRKPLTDNRSYARFTLDNGLKVMVISDPDSEKSAAALKVNTGSWDNPVDRLGLAHFLEHMLFLGTEKYPDPDDYSNFIQTHGGSNNAFTSSEQTAYFFDIEADYFEPALDRFAQFFISPNFDEELVNRELNAVNAEYKSGLQQDGRRVYEAFQTVLNQNHPNAKLSVGNLETLATENLRDDLITFFNNQYSADQMTLVIYSNQSTKDLSNLAVSKFNFVAKIDTDALELPPLFNADSLPAYLQIKSIKDLRELTLSFPVPGPENESEARPGKLVSWLLNQKSTGSLIDVLKKQGLADSLYSGVSSSSRAETTFDISIQLTRQGLSNIDAVGTLVFDAIQQIQRDSIPNWKFDEINRLQELRFNYQEAYNPMSYTIRLATQLERYSEVDSLFGPYKYTELNPEKIQAYLQNLSVENVLVMLTSPKVKTTDKSRYYNTEFKLDKLSDDRISLWRSPDISSDLLEAQPNPFIPESLQIFSDNRVTSKLYPQLPDTRIDADGLKFWFLQSNEFISPKVDTRLSLQSDWFYQNIKNEAATELYLALIKDSLDDISRDASLAGLGYGLWLDSQGVALRIYGYQDKLSLYADVIANELVSHEVDAKRFELIQERLIRSYTNQDKDALPSLLYRQLTEFVSENHSNSSEMAATLKQLKIEDLIPVQLRLIGQVSLEMLTVGNILPANADDMASRLAANFTVSEQTKNSTGVMTLDRLTAHMEFKSNQADSGILLFYQGESDSFREQALYSLMTQMTQSRFFNDLRTEKQLGYVVRVSDLNFHQLPGLGFLIQSPNTDPGLLLLHIDKFIREHLSWLNNLESDVFEQYKSGLISQLTEPDKNLLEKSGRFWSNIRYQVPHFNQNKRIALEVEKISQTGMVRFYQNQILNPDSRRIAIYHVGDEHRADFNKNRAIKAGERVLRTSDQYQKGRPVYKF